MRRRPHSAPAGSAAPSPPPRARPLSAPPGSAAPFPPPRARPLGARELRWLHGLAGILTRWSPPHFHGLERIPPERPLMFVGNHTLFGLYDLPHLWLTLYRRYGLMLRGLADHVHARIPLWWWLLSRYGAVVGTPENAAWLLQRGESLLVFPGGGREVARRRGDKYRLHWKQRAGFARLAAAHRCTIVPFAQVGAEEAWDVVVDADQLMQTPVGALVRRLGWRPEVLWPPVVRGLGPTAVPRPGPLHFYFGEPLPGDTHGAHPQDPQSCFALRERVRQAVQAGIEQLLEHRDRA